MADQQKRTLFAKVVKGVFWGFRFLFNLFITFQVFFLVQIEGTRLKNLLLFIINNSKTIKVRKSS